MNSFPRADSDGLHRCPIKIGCICDPASNTQSEYDWSFVDTIMCICLRDRNDRLLWAAEQFHRVGLCAKVVFYRPERPSPEFVSEHKITAGIYGCWESHRAVAILACDRFRSKTNLVFEDDVEFTNSLTPNYLQIIAKHVRQDLDPDWEMYMLGHTVHAMAKTKRIAKHLRRTKSSLTHAFIESESLMERLRVTPFMVFGRDPKNGRQTDIDNWFGRNVKQYACVPMVAVQRDLTSDIRPGGSCILTKQSVKVLEPLMIHQHKTIVISTLIIVLIIVIAIYLVWLRRNRKSNP